MSNFEEEYVPINGIEHYMLHYPKAPGAPVLLYIHGGPGSPESIFAYDLDETLGDMFTHVHWDQRGAGKTLRRNGKNGRPQTIEQMLDDLHGVAGYLAKKYNTQKLVLLGHSWGSMLGSLYVLRHPESALAYIGVGQVISMVENERTAYRETLEQAKKAGNAKHLRALEKLKGYPPSDPELLLKQLTVMRKIQAAYDNGQVSGSNLIDMIRLITRSPSYKLGDLYGFTQVMKVNHPLHLEMLSVNIAAFPPVYHTPVHYILGECDEIAPTSLGRAYFDTIEAPRKSITIIPGAGHNPPQETRKEFAAAMQKVRDTL